MLNRLFNSEWGEYPNEFSDPQQLWHSIAEAKTIFTAYEHGWIEIALDDDGFCLLVTKLGVEMGLPRS